MRQPGRSRVKSPGRARVQSRVLQQERRQEQRRVLRLAKRQEKMWVLRLARRQEQRWVPLLLASQLWVKPPHHQRAASCKSDPPLLTRCNPAMSAYQHGIENCPTIRYEIEWVKQAITQRNFAKSLPTVGTARTPICTTACQRPGPPQSVLIFPRLGICLWKRNEVLLRTLPSLSD